MTALMVSMPVAAEMTGDDKAGIGNYSSGYRMGRIDKCSVN